MTTYYLLFLRNKFCFFFLFNCGNSPISSHSPFPLWTGTVLDSLPTANQEKPERCYGRWNAAGEPQKQADGNDGDKEPGSWPCRSLCTVYHFAWVSRYRFSGEAIPGPQLSMSPSGDPARRYSTSVEAAEEVRWHSHCSVPGGLKRKTLLGMEEA